MIGDSWSIMKKRKPDILWVLVIVFGLGVVTTGYTQSLLAERIDQQMSMQQVTGVEQR